MVVMTVTGEIDRSELGVTIAHEHCFIDLRALFEGDDERPVVPSLLAELRTRPFSTTRDSLLLDNDDVACEELRYFAEAGGRTVVDVTPIGVGRDPRRLRRLAEATGLSIVMGLSTEPLHPPEVRDERRCDRRAVRAGDPRRRRRRPRGRDRRARGLGRAGAGRGGEGPARRCARRARDGSRRHVHLDPRPPHPALAAIDVLEREGLPPDRIVAGHLDVVQDLGLHRAVAARGVFVQFDQRGCECYADELGPNFSWGHDAWRLPFIRTLVEEGHGAQLLLSQDVAMKMDLRTYGGRGYAHVLRWVVPTLEQLGVPRSALHAMLVDNPSRAFALAERLA